MCYTTEERVLSEDSASDNFAKHIENVIAN